MIDCFEVVLLCSVRRKGRRLFFTGKMTFLNNFLWILKVLRKWSYNMLKNCHKTLWTLIGCSLWFVIPANRRKHWPKLFFHWKTSLFSEVYVFNNHLGPKEKILSIPRYLPGYIFDLYEKPIHLAFHTRYY